MHGDDEQVLPMRGVIGVVDTVEEVPVLQAQRSDVARASADDRQRAFVDGFLSELQCAFLVSGDTPKELARAKQLRFQRLRSVGPGKTAWRVDL